MYLYLMVLTICATSGLQIWRVLFDNFSVHAIGLDGHHIGIIQSVREIPGFLCLLVVYVLLLVREHRLAAFSVITLGAGVALAGFFPSFAGIICTTLLLSFGFHYFETTNQSLTLQYFDKQQAPLVFGKLRSIAAASCIVVSIVVFVLSPVLSYKQLFLLFGGIIIVATIWMLSQNPVEKNVVPQHKHMIFRRKYWLYYCLTFMAGARRQIFIAFAVFLLVKKFDYTVQEVAILFLLNNGVNFFLAPFIGKCINRFGERKVLSLEYGALIFIFIAYAMVDSKILAALLYIADHIFFNFAIAIRTFFQKIADPADIAPSMAVGFTINHIAAVVLPIIGGMLWLVDYRIPFLTGAALSCLSLVLVQNISSQLEKHSAPRTL
jgi:predicted MFS family arabinose efflux permease